LYNLGAVAFTEGRTSEALDFLSRSLERSHPRDTLVPKLFCLLTRAHHQMGQKEQALALCRNGRRHVPQDAELLFWESLLLREQGDLRMAEQGLLQILQLPRREHLTSVDAGLFGYRTRHLLAEICQQQGRVQEAETHWRAALGDYPGFSTAAGNLGEIFLEQGRWDELEGAVAHLERHVPGLEPAM